MDRDFLSDLLRCGESDSLDWKRDFPPELVTPGSDREEGKDTLLKDIVAIANGAGPQFGHLVYGVKDDGSRRHVLGISLHLDDADVQTWVEPTFDPSVSFQYTEKDWNADRTVGIFTIERVPDYPHVATRTMGRVLHEGQVWFRRGSKNTVALRDDLKRMILGEEPFKIPQSNDPIAKELKKRLEEHGERVCFPRRDERDVKLVGGFRLAYYPGTRREIWIGVETLMMLMPRSAE